MPDYQTDPARHAGGSRCEAVEVLLSGYLDGELTQQEAQRVRVHLDTCEHCRAIHDELNTLRSRMKTLRYPQGDDAVLAALEADLVARGSALVGWVLLTLGALVVVGLVLFGFFVSGEVPLGVRLFYGLFIAGGLALFVSVLRQRLLSWKHDKYRKVKL